MFASRACLLGVVVVGLASPAWAQTGLTYRFKTDTLTGQVWVQGAAARRELESGERGTAKGRVEISKQGGKQRIVVNTADRTYYDNVAFPGPGFNEGPTVGALTVRSPFRVQAVENVRVDLKPALRTEYAVGNSCRRTIITFSYTLTLSLDNTGGSTFPARVEGIDDVCVLDERQMPELPFGQALVWKSSHPEVDRVLAERLSSLKGMPIMRVLRVSRTIEGGETVASTTTLSISDIRETEVTPDRFEVPKGYRLEPPKLIAPVRR
jgi:hypothetical protein